MPKTLWWEVTYNDETVVTSDEANPEEIPLREILQIYEVAEDDKSRTLHNVSYYWWLGENWACGELHDLMLYLMERHREIKYGRTVNDSNYEYISRLRWETHH